MIKLVSAFLCALLFASTVHALAGGSEVGNGGDIRRYRVEEAMRELFLKVHAYVYDMPACSPPSNDVERDFQSANGRLWFAPLELKESNYTWVDEPQSSCLIAARSKVGSGWDLKFSYSTCPKRAPSLHYYSDLIINALYDLDGVYDHISISIPPYGRSVSRLEYVAALTKIRDLDPQLCAIKGFNNLIDETPINIGNTDLFKSIIQSARTRVSTILNTNMELSSIESDPMNPCNNEAGMINIDLPYMSSALDRIAIEMNDVHNSCGYTDGGGYSPILISFQSCQELRTIHDVEWVMLHELTHEAFESDETIADDYATSILDHFYPAALGAKVDWHNEICKLGFPGSEWHHF